MKIFSFFENSIFGKYLFFEKYFTWTKHSQGFKKYNSNKQKFKYCQESHTVYLIKSFKMINATIINQLVYLIKTLRCRLEVIAHTNIQRHIHTRILLWLPNFIRKLRIYKQRKKEKKKKENSNIKMSRHYYIAHKHFIETFQQTLILHFKCNMIFNCCILDPKSTKGNFSKI